jgi:Ca2+-binding EF-hand superfamily protein
MERRRSKKSESIEIRLTLEDKQALMDKAASEGRSASDIVRASIASYPSGDQGRARPLAKWSRAAGLLLIPSIVLATAYSISSPANGDRDYRRAFEATLARLDKNHDGMIDRHEFAGQMFIDFGTGRGGDGSVDLIVHRPPNPLASLPDLRGDFAAQDENGDGRITLAEYLSYRRTLAHQLSGTLDADSNGQVSLAEFRHEVGVPAGEPGRKLFAARDLNHDGWLSEQELAR